MLLHLVDLYTLRGNCCKSCQRVAESAKMAKKFHKYQILQKNDVNIKNSYVQHEQMHRMHPLDNSWCFECRYIWLTYISRDEIVALSEYGSTDSRLQPHS